jgi:hypothetical protein
MHSTKGPTGRYLSLNGVDVDFIFLTPTISRATFDFASDSKVGTATLVFWQHLNLTNKAIFVLLQHQAFHFYFLLLPFMS